MRIGFPATVWALVVVAGGLAGCGGSHGSGRSAGISPVSPGASAQMSSPGPTNCQGSSETSGASVARPCVFVLSDGRRFSCPQAFGHMVPGADTLELAGACRRLSPLAIPLSWRAVFAALHEARACLTDEGLNVGGGPSLGLPRDSPDTPIGELLIADGDTPTLIGFYENSRVARQSEPTAIRNAGPRGQVERRDQTLILWTRRPTRRQRVIAETCAFIAAKLPT